MKCQRIFNNLTHIIAEDAKTSENKGAYINLFQHLYNFIKPKRVTLIADLSPCIESAANEVFGDNLNHIYCSFHVWRILRNKFSDVPCHIYKSFFRMYIDHITINDFFNYY